MFLRTMASASPPPPPTSLTSQKPLSSPPSQLPLRKIPGSYGLPLLGPLSDRLDYFWFQGPEKFFKTRTEKYKSTVFRTNIPPAFPFFGDVNPNIVAVLDVNSFSHLFDMDLVDKRDVLIGDFRPSLEFYGGVRSGVYLDTTEPKHAKIQGCRAHLIDGSEAVELAAGDFELVQVFDNGVALAMVVRIGNDLQWPVIKDEPVVKLDSRDYLFTLPVKDGDPLSYGVTFFPRDENDVVFVNSLELLDDFLRENSCFSSSSSSSASASSRVKNGIDWKEFAPRIEDYNNVVAKAIAGGTGHIIRGMFKCSNAYTNQVHKGGEIMITKADKKNGASSQRKATTNKNQINKNLQRVRRLSRATEKLSKTMLNGVGVVSGSVMGPVVKSKPGKAFFSMVPGEVLLASLDALNKLLDAAEAAERQTLSATSNATTKIVSERLGESAGEATRDVLGTVGHAAGTAMNVLKLRKAFYPSSSLTSGILKNASRK